MATIIFSQFEYAKNTAFGVDCKLPTSFVTRLRLPQFNNALADVRTLLPHWDTDQNNVFKLAIEIRPFPERLAADFQAAYDQLLATLGKSFSGIKALHDSNSTSILIIVFSATLEYNKAKKAAINHATAVAAFSNN